MKHCFTASQSLCKQVLCVISRYSSDIFHHHCRTLERSQMCKFAALKSCSANCLCSACPYDAWEKMKAPTVGEEAEGVDTWRKVFLRGGAGVGWKSTYWGSAVQPSQLVSEGVPRAWKILPSWSRSVSPGNHARRSSSSAPQLHFFPRRINMLLFASLSKLIPSISCLNTKVGTHWSS